MSRKKRKHRKMYLKRIGMEIFVPPKGSTIFINGKEVEVSKLRGYEFTRMKIVEEI